MTAVYFTITGEYLTEAAKSLVVEGRWNDGLNILLESIDGMTYEMALPILKGNSKMIGLSSHDENTLDLKDDDDTNHKELIDFQQQQKIFIEGVWYKIGYSEYFPFKEDIYKLVGNPYYVTHKGQGIGLVMEPTSTPPSWMTMELRKQTIQHVVDKFGISPEENRDKREIRLEVDARMARAPTPDEIRNMNEEEFFLQGKEPNEIIKYAKDKTAAIEAENARLEDELFDMRSYNEQWVKDNPRSVTAMHNTMKKLGMPSVDEYIKDTMEMSNLTDDERADKIVGFKVKILEQADGDFVRETIAGVEYDIPRAPLMHWAAGRFANKGIKQLLPDWTPVSPHNLKVAGDNPCHSDFMIGAGMDLNAFYNESEDMKDDLLTLKSKIEQEQFGRECSILSGRGCHLGTVFKSGETPDTTGSKILVVPNLGPRYYEDALKADVIISERGGATAHLVNVFREEEKPIVRIEGAMAKYFSEEMVIVDLNKGIVRNVGL